MQVLIFKENIPEALLLKWVKDSTKPLSIYDVLEKVEKEGVRFSTADMRSAIWNLIDNSQIELTSNLKIVIKNQTKQRR